MAIAAGNPIFCKNVQRDIDNLECYTKIAESKQDESVCDSVETTLAKNFISDKESCKIEVAAAKKDIGACDAITPTETATPEGFKSFCYWRVGIALNDKSVCDKITNQYYSNKCYEDIAKAKLKSSSDVKICENLQGNLKNECYITIAVNKKEIDVCENIQGNFKDECIVGVTTAKVLSG